LILGYSLSSIVPDKDGITASAAFGQLASLLYEQGFIFLLYFIGNFL
jgi:hypothetical protein